MVEIETIEEFEHFIDQDEYTLVEFYTTWCANCKQMKARLLREYADKIDIYTANLDELPSLMDRYGIMAVPKLIVFKNGEIVKQSANIPVEFLKVLDELLK